MAHTLGATTKIVKAVAPTAGTPGTMTATAVDGTSFGRCRFLLVLGAITATGTVDAKVQDCATSGGTYADVTGAELTQITDAGGGLLYAIDIPVLAARPFMKLVVVTATAAAVNGAVAELYNGSRNQGVTTGFTQEVVL